MDEQMLNQIPPQEQIPPPPPVYTLQPHRASMILAFGILGLVFCGIFGILAWVFGNEDLKKMNTGTMDPRGRDLTSAGRIIGIIAVGMHAIGILIGLVYLVVIMGILGAAAASGF